jgi:hypothetical protein
MFLSLHIKHKTAMQFNRNSVQLTYLILLFLVTGLFVPGFSQTEKQPFRQDDVWRIFTKDENMARRDSLSSEPHKIREPMYAITPFVGYNPAYGMLVGVGASIGMYLGNPATTPISSANVVVNLTSKAQKIFNFRSNIVTNESKFILRGDWRFLIFSQPTYGLGAGIKHESNEGVFAETDGDGDHYSGITQPIDYNYIRLYETFYARIKGSLYVGVGYCLDHYSKIVDHKLNLDTVPQQITSHYKYSVDNGFNTSEQTVSGLIIELLLDSRNNSIRPTKGYFANLGIRPSFSFLGSSRSGVIVNTEFRTYLPVSKRRPDHLVGFWYLGQFTVNGKIPYLGLPAIGWDMYNRTGRGYIQGSVRGVSLMYGETEYRFPISRNTGILGGVLFVNATTASSADGTRKMFEYVDPAAGCGIRVMFNRKTLSNLTVDVGVGRNGTVAVYFNLNETF